MEGCSGWLSCGAGGGGCSMEHPYIREGYYYRGKKRCYRRCMILRTEPSLMRQMLRPGRRAGMRMPSGV